MIRMGKLSTYLILLALLLIIITPVQAQDQPVRIIFLHHSTGHNLIEEGGVRELFTNLGYEFYDHGYNDDGLRLADGTWTGENYDIPGDNTDPDGIAELFSQPLNDPPDNAFSLLMQYDVIMFKSCFPTSNIESDEHLNELKGYYLTVRDRVDQYPDKLFIVVTQPPQVPRSTDQDETTRARALANWLASDEYLGGRANLVTFDFFDYLAGDDNMLRQEYRYNNRDAHPNELANQTIAPLFVEFTDQAIQNFVPGTPAAGAEPAPAEGEPAEEAAPESAAPAGEAPATTGLIEGFEAITTPWNTYTESDASVVECGADANFAHGGTASLRMHYDLAAGGWVDCGTHYESQQTWGGDGLSLWYLTDDPGRWVTIGVYSGDAENATPFEISFETTQAGVDDWMQVNLPWSDFELAQWADATGLTEIDTARITGYTFSVGADDPTEGIVWIDDIGLMGVEVPIEESEPAAEEPADSQPSAGEEAVEDEAPAGEAETAEEEEGGGICPLGVIVMPLAVLSAAWFGRDRWMK